MQAYGSDRVRAAGGRFIIHAPVPKGWTPRSIRTRTSPEHPGTTVSWDGEYFEVVAAEELDSGGIRYVLAPWRDELTIRRFDGYDEESERRRHADHTVAVRQRRRSLVSQMLSVVLGHCPAGVQMHLGNELGVNPAWMTIISAGAAMLLCAVCIYMADAMIRKVPSRLPFWLAVLAVYLAFESLVRFIVAMRTNRPFGSLFGVIFYSIVWLIVPARFGMPSPGGGERGYNAAFTIPPPDDVVWRDSFEVRGPLLALLPAKEQVALAEKYGFEYLRHARPIAWILLGGAVLGLVTAIAGFEEGMTFTEVISALAALFVAGEQVHRLIAFRRGPAGSVLGILARPFVRDLLSPR